MTHVQKMQKRCSRCLYKIDDEILKSSSCSIMLNDSCNQKLAMAQVGTRGLEFVDIQDGSAPPS